MKLSHLVVIMCLCLAENVLCTSLPKLGFEDQIRRSESIVIATVSEKKTRVIDTKDGQAIVTLTRLNVEKVMFGETADTLELETLGGSTGGFTMHVAGMPSLETGSKYVLFVKDNGRTICPLVGWQDGSLAVKSDEEGQERVSISNLSNLHAATLVNSIGRELEKAGGMTGKDSLEFTVLAEKDGITKSSENSEQPALLTVDLLDRLVKHIASQVPPPAH